MGTLQEDGERLALALTRLYVVAAVTGRWCGLSAGRSCRRWRGGSNGVLRCSCQINTPRGTAMLHRIIITDTATGESWDFHTDADNVDEAMLGVIESHDDGAVTVTHEADPAFTAALSAAFEAAAK